jgi:hypothetical protein
MKRSYLYIFITIIAVFLVVFYFVTINSSEKQRESEILLKKKKSSPVEKIIHEELGEIKLPSLPDVPNAKKIPVDNQKSHNETASSTAFTNEKENVLSEEDIIKVALQEFTKNTKKIEESLEDIGFKEKGVDAIVSKNLDSLLSIKDMPEILRDAVRKELEKSKKNGYDEVDEKDVNEIIGIINVIVGTTTNIPNITFKLSNIPLSIANNYEYIGYTFPNNLSVNNPNIQHDTVQRVFQRLDSSSVLVIEESSLSSGGAKLVKEFVNSSVNGLPAIYAIKKSNTNKTYAMLNWTTKNFAYSLYQIGNLKDSKPILLYAGNELTKNNLQKDNSQILPEGDSPPKEK